MSFFKQVVLENEMGTYVMPLLFCKKVNISHGFKAFGEDLKTTETLTSGASGINTKIAEVGVRMEEKPGELCPEKRGIHFVPLSHIEVCLNSWDTFYGNKIALIEPIEDEIYYEYMENVFVGNKVFVSKVMKLYEVDTWRKLSEMSNVVKEKKNEICNYLRGLDEEIGHEEYGECIEFVSKL